LQEHRQQPLGNITGGAGEKNLHCCFWIMAFVPLSGYRKTTGGAKGFVVDGREWLRWACRLSFFHFP
jgi:hypothetical protein